MKKTWRVLVILAAPVLALGVLFALPRPVDIIIDNSSRPISLRISVNGLDMGVVKRWGTLTLDQGEIHAGEVTLTAVEIGPEGQKGRTLTLKGKAEAGFGAARPTYVWNVDGMSQYYVVLTQGYGDQEGQAFSPEKLQPESAFFAIPDGVIPTLDQKFPKQIKRGPGEGDATGVTRKALFTDRFVASRNNEAKLGSRAGQVLQDAQEQGESGEKGVILGGEGVEAEKKEDGHSH